VFRPRQLDASGFRRGYSPSRTQRFAGGLSGRRAVRSHSKRLITLFGESLVEPFDQVGGAGFIAGGP
jgi:hypothetical protein